MEAKNFPLAGRTMYLATLQTLLGAVSFSWASVATLKENKTFIVACQRLAAPLCLFKFIYFPVCFAAKC